MMMRKLTLTVLSVMVLLAFTGCKATDVVGKVASTSFKAVIDKIPDQIKADDTAKAWALTSPTGERFLWSKDFSGQGTSDAMLEFDAKPFIDAGLDIAKLPQ